MRLIIAAVGRLKNGTERDLYDRYATRFDATGRTLGLGPIKLAEIGEARSATADLRKSDEAQRLVKVTGSADVRVALEERGDPLSSPTQ